MFSSPLFEGILVGVRFQEEKSVTFLVLTLKKHYHFCVVFGVSVVDKTDKFEFFFNRNRCANWLPLYVVSRVQVYQVHHYEIIQSETIVLIVILMVAQNWIVSDPEALRVFRIIGWALKSDSRDIFLVLDREQLRLKIRQRVNSAKMVEFNDLHGSYYLAESGHRCASSL